MDPLDRALVNAVHALANKKLQAAANTIKQASNANGSKKQQLINNLTRQLAEAKQAAQAAQAVAPAKPVTATTGTMTNSAEKAVNNANTLIANIGKGRYNNKIQDPFYSIVEAPGYRLIRKANINKAVSARLNNMKRLTRISSTEGQSITPNTLGTPPNGSNVSNTASSRPRN